MGIFICPGTTGPPFTGLILSSPQNLRRTNQSLRLTRSMNNQQTGAFLLKGSTFILGCKKDQRLKQLNQYLLIYTYFLEKRDKDIITQIQQVTTLLKTIDEKDQHKIQIQYFRQAYLKLSSANNNDTPALRQQRALFLMKQIFKNRFVSTVIQQFTTITQDPSVLGYIRCPLADLNKGIKAYYERSQKLREIFCVIQVNENQKTQELIQSMEGDKDYLTFSTFVRCFSDQDKAKKRRLQLQRTGKKDAQGNQIKCITIFFYIQLPKEQIDPKYDNGYAYFKVEKDNPAGDVIMNIMNFFQVINCQRHEKQYTLKYNGLARLVHQNRGRLISTQPDLLKINNLLESKSSEINSYSSLMKVVGQRDLSISSSQMVLNSSITSYQLGSQLKIQDSQIVNLIESYIQNRQYGEALKICTKPTLQFKVRQAQIYYQYKKTQKVDSLIVEITPKRQTLKNQFFTQYILFELILCKRKIAKGQTQGALTQLKIVRDIARRQYKGMYEFKGRQIQKLIGQLEGSSNDVVDWNNYSDGLNLGIFLSH